MTTLKTDEVSLPLPAFECSNLPVSSRAPGRDSCWRIWART
jgi:hypothetical protein